MKVFGVNLDGRYRGIVAAATMTAAARACGISYSHFKTYGSETFNGVEVAIALQHPGTVYRQKMAGRGGEPWETYKPHPYIPRPRYTRRRLKE